MSGSRNTENDEERRKIRQMYREKTSKTDSDRVNFLYKDKVDSEEYLLGKRVDANFEKQNVPQKSDSGVGAKFDEDPAKHNERINSQIKQREDPLSAIRKQEEDARKALLNNPMKMKQLEKAIKEQRSKRRSKDGDELLARYMAITGAKISSSKEKRKRKLPDDDKSLLYRYLELIGKARRKRFYSDTSDEEEDSRHRPISIKQELNSGGSERQYQDLGYKQEIQKSNRLDEDRMERRSERRKERHGEDRKETHGEYRNERHGEYRNERDGENRNEGRSERQDEGRSERRAEGPSERRTEGRSERRSGNSKEHKNGDNRDRQRYKDSSQERHGTRSGKYKPVEMDERCKEGDDKYGHSNAYTSRDDDDKRYDRSRRHNSPREESNLKDRKNYTRDKLISWSENHERNSKVRHSLSPSDQRRHESSEERDKMDRENRKRKHSNLTARSPSNSRQRSSKGKARGSKRRRTRSISSSDSSDDNAEKAAKYKHKGKNKMVQKKSAKRPSSSHSGSSSGNSSRSESNTGSSSGSDSESSHSSAQRKNKIGPALPPSSSTGKRRARSSDSDDNSESLRQLEDEKRAIEAKLSQLPSYGLVHPKGESALEAKAVADSKRKVKTESSDRKKSASPKPSSSRRRSKERLTAEEKKARLREMQDNAQWRDEQRAKNVARYEEEQRREDEEYERNAGKNDDFIAPMMTKHAGESSVEEQLRRNRKKIQRTSSGTEKNFARK